MTIIINSYRFATSGGGGGGAELVTLTYDADAYDGIFNWMGTNDGAVAFGNPATESRDETYTATQSSNQDGTRTADKATDHGLNASTQCTHTTEEAGAWWKADFGATRTVEPTHLALVGRDGFGQHPRNFKLQGSNDDAAWTDLLTVTGAGPDNGTWWSSAVSGASAYRYLRILQTGDNSSGREFLIIGEAEIWGTVYDVS